MGTRRVEHEKKRCGVVEGMLKGEPTDKIAADVGTSRRNVQKIIAEPATQLLVTNLFEPHHKKLRNMAKRAVEVVQQGFSAKRYVKVGKDEYKLHGDTLGRLKAVERYGELVELAQGKVRDDAAPTGDIGRSYTWEEFSLLARKVTSNAQAPDDNANS